MNERGLTLIEVLVVSTILALIVAASTTMFSSGARVFARETVAVELLADMSGAKNVFLDDMSVAGFRPDGVVLGPIAALSPSGNQFDAVEFIADVDSDQVSERICYSLVGSELRRSVQDVASACGTGAEETLAGNIQTFAVTFWDDADPRNQLGDAAVFAGSAHTARVALALGASRHGNAITRVIAGEVALRN